MNILIKSANIIDKKSPFHQQVKDLLIKEDQIVEIADVISLPKNTKEINLENLHISNGWFDTSVSFGEPGYEERETIENGLEVAAKSGFTDVAVNSNNTPYTDTKSAVSFLLSQSRHKATDLYPIANLTRQSEGFEMAELYDMKNAGAIAFGDYNKSITNDNLMKLALLYAQNFKGLVLSFPLNTAIAADGMANESENSTRLGLKGMPNLAEELQISRDLFLLEYTGGKLHIPSISTAKSVALIREAKRKNLQVTCSVTAHHLLLTDTELESFNGNVKVLPPLRTKTDIKALLKGIKDGTIDCITSDHNPIDIEHKKVEFNNAKYGTIGLENLFASLHTILDTETIIDKLTTKPREIFGLEENIIDVGNKACLSLFNPDKTGIFTESDILSTSKNAIFLDKKIKGEVYGIYTNNQLVIK